MIFSAMSLPLEKVCTLVCLSGSPKDVSNVLIFPFHQGVSCSIREIPSSLVNKLRRIASFHNPEFHKAERLRLSTWDKPRIISRAELTEEGFIVLPRGCQVAVEQTFTEVGIICNVED